MTFDAIITADCVNTSTSTSTSTTTVSTTTLSTTSTSSTSTATTTCMDTSLATVAPDIFSGTPSFFGAYPAGYYRVSYLYGAMKYNNGFSYWNLNNSPAYGFRLVYSGGLNVVEGPMVNYDAFPTPDEVAANNAGANVEFYHAGGTIGMFLQDQPYTDNAQSPQGNPTFRLYSICNPPATTPTTTTVTTTTISTTSTTPSTTTRALCSGTYSTCTGGIAPHDIACSTVCDQLDAIAGSPDLFDHLPVDALDCVHAPTSGTFSFHSSTYSVDFSSHQDAEGDCPAVDYYDIHWISTP